ncbi:uncharacterized protein KY384_008377 [Bacidia gigantensis]|uniref:uncharacterized protein n=1 Tax=Bacidia gigantensis TaxID=2732470 RepID=UPI001D05A986|nr:uncharacterized protein KY384_008377 [Bacidia gigantensis]KAG8526948.1 hypothetical protein KY384_008377 [Bacidia gigantensis]
MRGVYFQVESRCKIRSIRQYAIHATRSPQRFLRTLPIREKKSAQTQFDPRQRVLRVPVPKKYSQLEEVEAESPINDHGTNQRVPISNTPIHEPVVRWYQQLTPWSKERRLSDPDTHYIDDEDKAEIKSLKNEIDRLDQELREMQEGSVGKGLVDSMIHGLSPEDQQAVRNEIEKRELQRKQEKLALAEYLPRLEIKWTLPPQQSTYLRNLNTKIRNAAKQLEQYTSRRRLWMSYARCKAFLPPFLHLVPPEAWLVLYESRAIAAAKDDAHWARHLIVLVEDMRVAQNEFHPHQIMLYIEALRFEGRHRQAIQEWQDLKVIFENDERASTEYELLGVRLFTSQGDLGKAEDIATEYLKSGDKSESRILIPILDTWVERKDDISMKHGWALYLKLKLQLGPDITMQDYGSVYLSFLHRNRADLALAVFKDMMLTGQCSGQDSLDIYRKSMMFSELQHNALDAPGLNEISLRSMTVLPLRFQNKWFYASWIKKLIGMDEADSAAAVVDLMYERGIPPDAKHLNGIIGAWLRTASDTRKVKAERMAWVMIHQRLKLVQLRTSGFTAPLPNASSTASDYGATIIVPQEVKRAVPCATIETFCLLLQFYARRRRYQHIEHLQKALEQAELSANSYWMNDLLYMGRRQHKYDLVWQSYKGMTECQIQPDLVTFACLWECSESHNKAAALGPDRSFEFPSPRRIMCEQMAWLETLRGRKREEAKASVTQELYERIICCMAQSHDLAGIVVSLYIMRDQFGYYPTLTTNRNVVKQIARMTLRDWIQTHGLTHRRRPQLQAKNEAMIEKALKDIQDERSQMLVDAGYDDFEQLDDQIRREERLYMLAAFLRAMISRMSSVSTDVEALIKTASLEMGCTETTANMGDPMSRHAV